MNPTIAGFSLIVGAAICGGAFTLPLKWRRRFALENIYVLAPFAAMILIPLLVAHFFLPDWPRAIRNAGSETIAVGIAYGFGWGLGAVAFGYGVTLAGISVGYAVIMGVNTIVGSIIPFVINSPKDLFTSGGMVVLAGIGACIPGVVVCGMAGASRHNAASRDSVPETASGHRGASFWVPLLVCIVSGFLSACANLGFAFTTRVVDEMQKFGAAPAIATLGSWILVYWGAFAAIVLWFGALQIWKGTWRLNVGPGAAHDWAMAGIMGILWFLAMLLYGIGAVTVGRLGTSIGWAVNISASLLVANALGFITGEWKGASKKSLIFLGVGLLILVLAMITLGIGNSMLSR